MLQMMRYGGSNQSLSANFVLSTDLQPYNRCISKSVAITAEADVDAMNAWEESQDHSLNVIPFPQSRLMPPQAIAPSDPSNPFAELFDDRTLTINSQKTDWGDSWKAGYTYEVTDITFDQSDYQQQYGNDTIQVDRSAPGYVTYTKGWVSIRLIVDDGSHTKIAYSTSDPRYQDDNWEKFYFKTDDGYANIGSEVWYYDLLGANTSTDRSATISFRATPLSGVIDYTSEDFKCVQPNRTHTDFVTTFYHRGTGPANVGWVDYPYASTSSISISHTTSGSSTLDLAVVLPGLTTNGTYWDCNGWHHAQQNSPLENAVSISKGSGSSSLNIDWNIVKNYIENQGVAVGITFYVYGCWDQMSSNGNHLIAPSGSSTTVSATGMQNQIFSVTSAGNLNKTEEESSIRDNYTCLYKVHWHVGDENVSIMGLEGSDGAYASTGVYGQIYPDSNFSRSENQNDTMRNYTASSSVVSGGSASVSITSTVNGSNVGYTVSQYFPVGSENYHETFTVNGQSLTDSNSISVSAGENLSINFGSISSGQARWLKLQQDGSPEFANLCFTFN